MALKTIRSDKLSPPIGPFSPALLTGDYIFLSGQIGQDPDTGQLVGGGVAEETRQILANAQLLLEASGKRFRDVARVGIFLTDMAAFSVVNAEYSKRFTEPFPARTTVAVAGLPLGAAVEIDMIVKA